MQIQFNELTEIIELLKKQTNENEFLKNEIAEIKKAVVKEKYISAKEAANILNYKSEQMIGKLVKQKKLKPYRVNGTGHRKFKETDVLNLRQDILQGKLKYKCL